MYSIKKYIKYFIPIFIIIFNVNCNKPKEKPTPTTLDIIKAKGKIVALTGYNAYSYFIYKGQPMGFEYDLLNQFGKYLNVDVEIKVVKNLNEMILMLSKGEGDLIAFNLTVTKERSKKIAFSHHTNTTTQVLVQRKPKNWRNLTLEQTRKKLITSPINLEGKTIYVRSGSSYIARLKNLSDEIGAEINIIIAKPDLTTENLIEMVAKGEIDYTISDDNIARLDQASYRNIDIGTKISLPQKIAWAVNKRSNKLLDTLNVWIDGILKKPNYYIVYNKYYKNRTNFVRRLKSQYFSFTGGNISKYDDILKKYSKKINWDWRLLAAQIYEESQFNPNAKSWAGAVGLMQLMPITAKQYGVEDRNDPTQSLKAGIKYISWLNKFWKKYIEDKNERIKFILASYNIGLGHIIDARKLTKKYGGEPNKWKDNVEFYLVQKSKKKYYNDEVVSFGYSRGIETVEYVKDVLDLYSRYKQFISENGNLNKQLATSTF